MARRMLVVAPLRVCHSVWPREIQKWVDFKHLRVVVLHGPDKEALLDADADVFLVNYEALDWLLSIERIGKRTVRVSTGKLERLDCDVLAFDELSMMKNGSSLRHLAMRQVLHLFGRRWGLTGTPAPNGLIDLWGQCFCLDMGRTFSPYITHFHREYFIPDKYSFGFTLMPGAEERIHQRLAPLVLEQGDDPTLMPELRDNIVQVDLPESVMANYRAMELSFLAAVEDKIVTASTAAAASTKIRQIAAGGIYHDAAPGAPRTWSNLHTLKVDALAELVGELQGQPLLCAYEFEHDVDRLKKRFPKAVYACDLTPKQFDKVVDQWNRGEIPLLFGHPASMGHGLNLQEFGSDVAFLNPTWNFELFDQFVRRVYRPGQKSKVVTVHHVIAAGTIDERVLGVIRSKDRTQSALFAALKQFARERLHAR